MKTIVFFNNKGGVGKTTLTTNVVSFLNTQYRRRVLLVDADPQCNATQALLNDEVIEQMYVDDKEIAPTLFDYLRPIEAGEPSLTTPIKPMNGKLNLFDTDLIPGHPKMSLVEDKLSTAWGQLQAGTPAGYRVTNWCSQLYREIENQYDLLVFDVGPSLGALNRTVILASDYLVTPFGSDIFSLLGIQNIASWLQSWKLQYDRAINNMRTDRPGMLEQYPIITDTENQFRFAGYSVQQYVMRSFKTGKRRKPRASGCLVPRSCLRCSRSLTAPRTTSARAQWARAWIMYS